MQHLESMGDKWFPLGIGESDIADVIAATLEMGGTRSSWSVTEDTLERMLLAWPADALLRTSVIVAGNTGEQLLPVSVAPFMEGAQATLKVFELYPWKDEHAGEIAAHPDGMPPLWFYDPLYFRDRIVEKGTLA